MTYDRSGLIGQSPHHLHVGPAQPILDRAPDGRTDIEQLDEGVGAGKLLFQPCLQVGPLTIASRQVLGDDNDLTNIRRLWLRIKGQQKPHRALADIGTPVLDIGVIGELFPLEPLYLGLCCQNGAVLRQAEVYHQFDAVGAGEELLLHHGHAEQ